MLNYNILGAYLTLDERAVRSVRMVDGGLETHPTGRWERRLAALRVNFRDVAERLGLAKGCRR